MNAKLELILTKDEISRIISKVKEDGEPEVTLDLHKLTVREARRLIGNIIAVNRERFELNLIHGYNHGTALRDMIRQEFKNPRIYERKQYSYNAGVTTFEIAGAA